ERNTKAGWASDFSTGFGNRINAGDQVATQGVIQALGDAHVDQLADQRFAELARGEIHDTVVLGAALQVSLALLGLSFDQDALHGADHRRAGLAGVGVDLRLQAPVRAVLYR